MLLSEKKMPAYSLGYVKNSCENYEPEKIVS